VNEHHHRHRRACPRELPAVVFRARRRISRETITEDILVKNTACWACPIAKHRSPRPARAKAKGRNTSRRVVRRACGFTISKRSPTPTHLQRPGHGYDLRRLDHRLRDGADRARLLDCACGLAGRTCRSRRSRTWLPAGRATNWPEAAPAGGQIRRPGSVDEREKLERPAYDPRGMQARACCSPPATGASATGSAPCTARNCSACRS